MFTAMWELRIQGRPSAGAVSALNPRAISPASTFNASNHFLLHPPTGPTLSDHYTFSPGLPLYAQGRGFNLRDYPLQASPTYAHDSARITASHDSWGSDHGPQCSHSSFGKAPQLHSRFSGWSLCGPSASPNQIRGLHYPPHHLYSTEG